MAKSKMIYIPIKVLEEKGIRPVYQSSGHKIMAIKQGGLIHMTLMGQGVMDAEGNILPLKTITKSIEAINHYGEWFMKLLDNHHYCLRRNLYEQLPHTFNHIKGRITYGCKHFESN